MQCCTDQKNKDATPLFPSQHLNLSKLLRWAIERAVHNVTDKNLKPLQIRGVKFNP